jgi:hypothetical protein|tara:strand:+ start:581 stop:877 length:297 start_codon:yes stop_codon:yes gene_type:complete
MAWAKRGYPSMARKGSKNGRWVDGSSQTHYRNKANAKPGKVVHHLDSNKSNNSRSNVMVVSKAKHNKLHPEKGGDHECKKGYNWSAKLSKCVKLSVSV